MDFKKAFAVVDLKILLAKLQKYGITGSSLDWFLPYLFDWSQIVYINGSLSQPQPADMSVI
jgi:hypothetical protein